MPPTIPLTKSTPQLLFTSALSTYGLYLSYRNITRLQQYEKQSEKAAEWSSTAAQRLHKTRSTQTSGTLTVRYSSLIGNVYKRHLVLILTCAINTASSILPHINDTPAPPFLSRGVLVYRPDRRVAGKYRYSVCVARTHGAFLERVESGADSVC